MYRSTNAGVSWSAIDNGLPDLPTNCILIDPFKSDYLYVGNDLGVHFSSDGGTTWESYSDSLPEATMVLDLNYSPSNRNIRVATHGHGIYTRKMVSVPVGLENIALNDRIKIYPNPASDHLTLKGIDVVNYQVFIFNSSGEEFKVENRQLGKDLVFNISELSPGLYILRISNGKTEYLKKVLIE